MCTFAYSPACIRNPKINPGGTFAASPGHGQSSEEFEFPITPVPS